MFESILPIASLSFDTILGLIFVVFVWVVPCLVLPLMAGDRGQDGRQVFFLAFILSWVGGIAGLLFLRVDEDLRDARAAERDGEMGGAAAEKRAPLSAARKRELEQMLGGK